MNGLSHLFPRRCIPGEVVQQVYQCTLDGLTRAKRPGDGTTEAGAKALAEWLNGYSTAHFRVGARSLAGSQVRLTGNSLLVKELKRGAVAVCDVSFRLRYWHSILLLNITQGWAEYWDPYVRRTLPGMAGEAELIPTDGYAPNLRIRSSWTDASRSHHLGFGPVSDRSALLLWKR